MKQSAASSTNKRLQERQAFQISGLAICDTGLRIPCKTIDISTVGARLRLVQPIRDYPGHTIEQLDLAGAGLLFVNVRWIQEREVGIRFDQSAQTREIMTAYMEELQAQSAASPRRAANRRAG
ncbi:MAG: PilZ domain-containing protein [Pelagimonas sp.]|jgi:hypothetical protein|nr:PilZ domain-containing protein [Pelagimonas sp.]